VIYVKFRKVNGAGNDFIILAADSSLDLEKGDWPGTARRLCAQHTGIGADGLVVSTEVSPRVLQVVCFNVDGSLATMCGNALRCVAWCQAQDRGYQEMTLLMAGVKHQAQVSGDGVWVTAEVGQVELRRVQAVWDGRPFWFDSAHTGTEHVVAVMKDVDSIDAAACGRLVRNHPGLAPLGTNVNFVQSAGDRQLKIRTYERGVEAETLSCASGAVAAVVIATARGLVTQGQVIVHNRAGTPLTVRPHTQRRSAFWIGGPVTETYRGELA